MKSKSFIAISFALGLLASCAHIDPHPMDMSSAIRNARTSADHNALARHYEDTAKRMQAKAQVQKNMLKEYTRHGYYYGRRTEELQEHTKALIRIYEEAAESNRNMAKFHHRLAEDASQ
jgi:hypothetical protein